MLVTEAIRVFYAVYFVIVCAFFIWFIFKVRGSGEKRSEEQTSGIDRREIMFFAGLVTIVIIAHVVTLSNWVPWQKWRLWSNPTVVQKYDIGIADYKFQFPSVPMTVKSGEFVEFDLTSDDVTYGFGVFRKDGTMVFQLQVLPGYKNKYVWNFDKAGYYDVRSTEYSGSEHSTMYVENAIQVLENGGEHE